MTKQEAINRAAAAREAAQNAYGVWVSYISLFGASDKITTDAKQRHQQALEAHDKWMWLASLHPSSRASIIRKQALPAFIFNFGA